MRSVASPASLRRLPCSTLLDQPRHHLGVRHPGRSGLRVRRESVRLAPNPKADPRHSPGAVPASSPRAERSGSFRSPSGDPARSLFPSAAGATGESYRRGSSFTRYTDLGKRRPSRLCTSTHTSGTRSRCERTSHPPSPHSNDYSRGSAAFGVTRGGDVRHGSSRRSASALDWSVASGRGHTLRVTNRVESHFQRRALSFDALYDDEALLSRRLRPGLVRRA